MAAANRFYRKCLADERLGAMAREHVERRALSPAAVARPSASEAGPPNSSIVPPSPASPPPDAPTQSAMHAPSPTVRHCTFRVGEQRVAVAADAVAEVLAARPTTPVPLAPAGVLGLVHVRGRIVPILDPAVRLGLPVAAPRSAAAHLVLRSAPDEWFGLLVDEVLDVVDIPPEAIERPSASEPDAPLPGVYAAPGGLVHVLDFRRMIQPSSRPRPQAS